MRLFLTAEWLLVPGVTYAVDALLRPLLPRGADVALNRHEALLICHTAGATMEPLMADRFDEILTEMRTERAVREAERAVREAERADSNARFAQLQEETNESRRFLSEMNRRAEVVFQEVVLELREMRAEIRESTKNIRESTELTKAHTRAIYAVIDRLEGGDGLSPAS